MKVNLKNIAIVLYRPHYPENIGAAARAAKNMGIGRLVVVDPRNCDLTRILTMATHAVADMIEEMEVHDDLPEALAPFHYIVGTTARVGAQRRTMHSPRNMARELAAISQSNQVAILFGPENCGLANRELQYCHALVTIPTADFASLNLAQAVMVIAYELFLAGVAEPKAVVPRLAASHELEGMYDQLRETLAKIHFINPENPDYWLKSIRRFASRVRLQAREVRIIRGICRQIDWYCESRLGSHPAAASSSASKSTVIADK